MHIRTYEHLFIHNVYLFIHFYVDRCRDAMQLFALKCKFTAVQEKNLINVEPIEIGFIEKAIVDFT